MTSLLDIVNKARDSLSNSTKLKMDLSRPVVPHLTAGIAIADNPFPAKARKATTKKRTKPPIDPAAVCTEPPATITVVADVKMGKVQSLPNLKAATTRHDATHKKKTTRKSKTDKKQSSARQTAIAVEEDPDAQRVIDAFFSMRRSQSQKAMVGANDESPASVLVPGSSLEEKSLVQGSALEDKSATTDSAPAVPSTPDTGTTKDKMKGGGSMLPSPIQLNGSPDQYSEVSQTKSSGTVASACGSGGGKHHHNCAAAQRYANLMTEDDGDGGFIAGSQQGDDNARGSDDEAYNGGDFEDGGDGSGQDECSDDESGPGYGYDEHDEEGGDLTENEEERRLNMECENLRSRLEERIFAAQRYMDDLALKGAVDSDEDGDEYDEEDYEDDDCDTQGDEEEYC